jgi:cyclase
MKARTVLLVGAVGAVGVVASGAIAQMGDVSKVTLKSSPVVGAISVIEGVNGFSGGNVGVSVGDDGAVLIDDGLPGLGPKLKAKVALLTKKPIRFVINTHWHFDHTGNNGVFAGGGSVLVAHDNVRKRMSVDQVIGMGGQNMRIPASPAGALPLITFGEDVTFHLNGDDVHVFHVAPAHTDGDVVVHFTRANVIHAGDVFINQGFPIVDASNGGRYQGLIAAADKLLALANDTTKIIPGHGPVGTRADVVAWKELLIQLRDKVARAGAGGKTLEQVKAARPLAEYDAKLGQGPIKSDMVVEMIQTSLTAR